MISKVLLQYEVYRYVVCLPRRVRQVMGLSAPHSETAQSLYCRRLQRWCEVKTSHSSLESDS